MSKVASLTSDSDVTNSNVGLQQVGVGEQIIGGGQVGSPVTIGFAMINQQPGLATPTDFRMPANWLEGMKNHF